MQVFKHEATREVEIIPSNGTFTKVATESGVENEARWTSYYFKHTSEAGVETFWRMTVSYSSRVGFITPMKRDSFVWNYLYNKKLTKIVDPQPLASLRYDPYFEFGNDYVWLKSDVKHHMGYTG